MRGARAAAYALVALTAAGFGAFVADPLAVEARLSEELLWNAGGRRETFPGPGGIRLSAWELGKLSAERPVILQHGIGASATYFRRAAIALREEGRTVILPDAAGSGRSEAPRERSGWGLRARVTAISSLHRALALEKVDLVGHSLGGWAAARWALENPRLVGRLVLVDSGGFTGAQTLPEDEIRARFVPADREGARALVAMLFHRKGALARGFVADALARSFRGDAVARTVEELSEDDLLTEAEVRALPEGTVFVWGEKDPLFPLEDARRAAAMVPGARLLVIRGTGHDPALEAPAAFHEALRRALAEDRPRSRPAP